MSTPDMRTSLMLAAGYLAWAAKIKDHRTKDFKENHARAIEYFVKAGHTLEDAEYAVRVALGTMR